MRAVRDERDVPRVFLSDVRVLGHVRFFVRVLRQSTRILHDARRHELDDRIWLSVIDVNRSWWRGRPIRAWTRAAGR